MKKDYSIIISEFFKLFVFDARFYITSIDCTENNLIILPITTTTCKIPSVFIINVPTWNILSFFVLRIDGNHCNT